MSGGLDQPAELFAQFIEWGISPAKRERYRMLVRTPTGRDKILGMLYHELEDDLDHRHRVDGPSAAFQDSRCVAYTPKTFGDACVSLESAMDAVSGFSSWLILSFDGRFAYHHPEDVFDRDSYLMKSK